MFTKLLFITCGNNKVCIKENRSTVQWTTLLRLIEYNRTNKPINMSFTSVRLL